LPPSTVPAPGSPGMSSKVFENLLKPVGEFNVKAPKPLCDLIHKCLAYQADKRPAKVTDVVEQLKALEEKLVRTPDDSLETMEW
jgi:hypothetical protein